MVIRITLLDLWCSQGRDINNPGPNKHCQRMNQQNLGNKEVQHPRGIAKLHGLDPTAKFQKSSLKKRGNDHEDCHDLRIIIQQNTDVREPRQVR